MDRILRTRLPRRDLVRHGIGDKGCRYVPTVEIAHMAHDLPQNHAARIHRDDLLVEIQGAPLALGQQLGIKALMTVAQHARSDLRISRRMGADFARSWARVSRHAGQPFHAIVGRLADSFMDSGLSDLVKRFCDGGAFSETFT